MEMKFSDFPIFDFGHQIQIAGVIMEGGGRSFRFYLPQSREECSNHHELELTQEEWQQLFDQTDKLSFEHVGKDADGKLTKVIVRKSERQINQNVSWAVYRRDGYRCVYCGNDKVPLTVDHLICYEALGPSTEANLVSACRVCNKTRSNLSYAEWLKHPHYRKVSAQLPPERRAANEALLGTLDKIPLVARLKSR